MFGMGTGVALSTQPPENLFEISNLKLRFQNFFGSGGLVVACDCDRTANRRGPRYGTCLRSQISNLRSQKSNSDQGK